MNIWSIIIAVAIFILPSLLPGKKNTGKKTVSAAPAPAPVMGIPEEDVTDTVDDGGAFFDEDDDYAEADDLGQPYFSYETVGENKVKSSVQFEEKEGVSVVDEPDSMPVTTLDEVFDLRKAIIYQTIMQRASA